jgi:hypothetical protein
LCCIVKHFFHISPVLVVWRRTTGQTRAFATVPPVPILSQMNPVHILTPYFPIINFNITTPRSSEWSRPFRFPNQHFARMFLRAHARCRPRSSHRPWFDHLNNTRCGAAHCAVSCSLPWFHIMRSVCCESYAWQHNITRKLTVDVLPLSRSRPLYVIFELCNALSCGAESPWIIINRSWPSIMAPYAR